MSQFLHVGDVILLENNQWVPADCVILETDNTLGYIYLNTANIDGESRIQ